MSVRMRCCRAGRAHVLGGVRALSSVFVSDAPLEVEEDTSRDWECEKCQSRNFAKRGECFKCKAWGQGGRQRHVLSGLHVRMSM